MTDPRPFRNIEDIALGTAVDLLGTLTDANLAAAPGGAISRYADDLRGLGDTARQAAADLQLVLEQRLSARHAVA